MEQRSNGQESGRAARREHAAVAIHVGGVLRVSQRAFRERGGVVRGVPVPRERFGNRDVPKTPGPKIAAGGADLRLKRPQDGVTRQGVSEAGQGRIIALPQSPGHESDAG